MFEHVYKHKEIVADPTNFSRKGRPKANKALYESQSGEPSVPGEMLCASTGNTISAPHPSGISLTAALRGRIRHSELESRK